MSDESDEEKVLPLQEADLTEEQDEEPPSVLEQPGACLICGEQAVDDETMHSCGDKDEPHSMCSDCFLAYAKVELASGAFEGNRFFGGDASSTTLISPPGNLPCPKFVSGECKCASLPLTTLFGLFHTSDELSRLYNLASRRVAYHEIEQDRQLGAMESAVDDDDAEEGRSEIDQQVEDIRVRVVAALDKGAVVTCPQCRQPGIKNEHCVHIRCNMCNNSWCYCCGRTRESSVDNAIRCKGCDIVDSRLERQPNWAGFAIGNETAAMGALHEFHRSRTAYFVQHIKLSTVPYQWQAFRAAHPNILKNVPTVGRNITWGELEEGRIEPPVFGNTRERDLLWAIQIPTHIQSPDATDDDEIQANQNTIQPQLQAAPVVSVVPFTQLLCSREGRNWLILLVLAVAMLVISLTLSGTLAVASGFTSNALFFIVAFYASRSLLLHLADYSQLNPRNMWTRYFPEVHFIGRRNADGEGEGPYLSAAGRWRHQRVDVITSPVRIFFFGGFLLSLSLNFNAGTTLGSLGLALMTPAVCMSLFAVCWLNYDPFPPIGEGNGMEEMRYKLLLGKLLMLQFSFFSTGSFFLFSDIETLFVAGVFLLMFGIACTFAEVAPQCIGYLPSKRSYLFFLGIAVESSCVWLYFYQGQADLGAVYFGTIAAAACWLLASRYPSLPGPVRIAAAAAAFPEEENDSVVADGGEDDQLEEDVEDAIEDNDPDIIVEDEGVIQNRILAEVAVPNEAEIVVQPEVENVQTR